MIAPDLNIRYYRREDVVKEKYSDFYQYLQDTYPSIDNFSEQLYLYHNNLQAPPLCPVCGNKVSLINFSLGYHKYCCNKCSSKDTRSIAKIKTKQTKLERYGDENYNNMEKHKSTCLDRYGTDNYAKTDEFVKKSKKTKLERYGDEGYSNIEKRIKTCSEIYEKGNYCNRKKSHNTCKNRYGTPYYFQTEEFKNKSKQSRKDRYGDEFYNNREQYKATCQERYGVDNGAKTEGSIQKVKDKINDTVEKVKNTCIERYGVDSFSKTDKYKELVYNTKKSNNTFNKSTIEDRFKQYLEGNHINFRYQYYSEQYPFDCDFYFPDKDIYLEINGSWTHGGHPYNTIEDKDKLELWIERSKTSDYYKNAIETWTIRDPKKVQIAKDNNINLKVFYGCELDKLIEFYKTF